MCPTRGARSPLWWWAVRAVVVDALALPSVLAMPSLGRGHGGRWACGGFLVGLVLLVVGYRWLPCGGAGHPRPWRCFLLGHGAAGGGHALALPSLAGAAGTHKLRHTCDEVFSDGHSRRRWCPWWLPGGGGVPRWWACASLVVVSLGADGGGGVPGGPAGGGFLCHGGGPGGGLSLCPRPCPRWWRGRASLWRR
jgi:hypothetical protein